MDMLIKALSPATKIRVTCADVTLAAKALEARHLAGPTAGAALAEGLVAAALLTADCEPDEAVTLQIKASGPLKGLVADARGTGDLRGYTHVKVMNDLDGRTEISAAAAFGESGGAHITRTLPGRILSQAPLRLTPPTPRLALARYLNLSLQVPAGAEIAVRSSPGGLVHARGLLAERMPDGSPDAFARVLERFESGAIRDGLGERLEPGRLAALTGLSDLAVRETRPLRFHCPCSPERVQAMLEALPAVELAGMAATGEAQSVVCHMCGRTHEVPAAVFAELARKREPQV